MTHRSARSLLERSTLCPCGGAIEPQVVDGRLIDYCTRCHTERPVDTQRPPDFVRYGQRAQLDAKLIATVEKVRRRGKRKPA